MTMTYQLNPSGYIRDQSLVDGTVVLSENDCRGLVDCTFASGTLRLAQSKGRPVIVHSTITDSDVVAVKRQRDYPLFDARFIGCTFFGTYSGIDFGHSDRRDDHGDFGCVERCDFTQATLDGCRFFNVDVSTLRLPRWPHVVIEEPHTRAADVRAMSWPGHLGEYMDICTNKPSSLKASVIHVPTLVHQVRCTESEAREAFEKFGRVLM